MPLRLRVGWTSSHVAGFFSTSTGSHQPFTRPTPACADHVADAGGPVSTHELEIERLNRLYSALRHLNRSIVQSAPGKNLFGSVCEVLAKHGGFRLACVGWHDPKTERLLPVAIAGDGIGEIEEVRVYADDRPEGRGPSGRAFRENRPNVCNDMARDPATIPGGVRSRGCVSRRRRYSPFASKGSSEAPSASTPSIRGSFETKKSLSWKRPQTSSRWRSTKS